MTTGIWADESCLALVGGSGIVTQIGLSRRFGKNWNWCSVTGVANLGSPKKIQQVDGVIVCDGDVVILTNVSLPMRIIESQRKVGIKCIGVIQTSGNVQVNNKIVMKCVETTPQISTEEKINEK